MAEPHWASFSETTPTFYTVMYSDDGGATWKHPQDGSAATPGVRPSTTYRQTTTTYNLATPAGNFPKGSYLLRVEAYRDDVNLHYANHQTKVFIKR